MNIRGFAVPYKVDTSIEAVLSSDRMNESFKTYSSCAMINRSKIEKRYKKTSYTYTISYDYLCDTIVTKI